MLRNTTQSAMHVSKIFFVNLAHLLRIVCLPFIFEGYNSPEAQKSYSILDTLYLWDCGHLYLFIMVASA